MVSFFRRRSSNVELPRVRARSRVGNQSVNRVSLGELTPEARSFLGRAAYVQLSIFTAVAHAVATAPHTRGKNALSRVAQLSLHKYEGLVAELIRLGHDPVSAMEPFESSTDRYQQIVLGKDWYECLVTSYVTAGLLDDFFVRLSGGLSDEENSRIFDLLSPDTASQFIVTELRSAIDANPRLASRLALWGRRLVGDTLLMARSALVVPEDTAPDETRLEPVFTDLIAAHTRRMDALGLTA
ncbi:MAG: hypothetical protein H7248_00785 [Microbacteriaceae bacterium]|nr:hypothetical protein [Microbacteriaceae bacterium]